MSYFHEISTFWIFLWSDLWAIFGLMGWAKFWALEMLEYMWTCCKSKYFIFSLLNITLVYHRGRPRASRFILSVPRRAESDRRWRSVVCQTTETIRSCHIGIRIRFSDLKSQSNWFRRRWSPQNFEKFRYWWLCCLNLSTSSLNFVRHFVVELETRIWNLSDNRCKGQFVESVACI